MARRRTGVNLNLDSLMDTLTNVVGFLVILMALLQLGVGDTVRKIVEANLLPPVSAEELRRPQQEAAANRARFDALAAEWKALSQEKLKLMDDRQLQTEKLAAVRAEAPKSTAASPDTAKQLAELKQALAELEKQYATAVEAIRKLQAFLAKAPAPAAAPPAKIVHLPNPRSAPQGATPVIFLCREGRVIPYDLERLRETGQKAASFIVRPKRGQTELPEIDCQRLVDHFEKGNFGDSDFRLRVKLVNYEPQLVLERRKNAGETPEIFRGENSDYQRTLRVALRNQQYARFWVWPDSFESYLEARQLADKLGLAAGWELRGQTDELSTPLGVAVTCAGKPKPSPEELAKPTPSPPPPSGPPPKPLPNDQVD